MLKDNWTESAGRYEDFWGGKPVDRSPVLLDAVGPWAHPMYRGSGYDYRRYGADLDAFRRAYLAVWEARAACRDDTIPCISAQYGGAIEAAFWAGEVDWGEEITTLRPLDPLAQVPDLDAVRFEPANRYYRRVLEETSTLSALAADRYGVNFEASLSVTTTLSQLLGAERFLLAFYDEPRQLRGLAERIAEVMIGLCDAVRHTVPRPNGGACHRWLNYWNPGWGFWWSEDDAIMLSPLMYGEFFSDLDARLCAACDVPAVHWHSGALHLLEAVSRIPRLAMLQISFDPKGPPLDAVLDACARPVETGLKVCFQIPFREDTLRRILRRLPFGSCMFYFGAARDIEEANRTVRAVEALCRDA